MVSLSIIIKDNSKIKRRDMQIFLEKKGIQTRTIFLKYTASAYNEKKYKKVVNCSINSDNIMKNGILIGCHQGLKNKEIKYVFSSIKKFLEKF